MAQAKCGDQKKESLRRSRKHTRCRRSSLPLALVRTSQQALKRNGTFFSNRVYNFQRENRRSGGGIENKRFKLTDKHSLGEKRA